MAAIWWARLDRSTARVLKAAVDSEVDEIAREDVPGWEAAQEVRGHRFPAAEEFRSAEDTRLKSAGRQER